MFATRLALVLLACSCDRRAPITSCTDDLAGTYVSADGQTWSVLDGRRALEVYPMFDDAPRMTGLEVAPRVIDLRRTGDAFIGEVTRRYLQGAARCDAKAAARVTSCKDDTLEIVLSDPPPPVAFGPCQWGTAASSHRERWRRR
jgi:hypothetical protein